MLFLREGIREKGSSALSFDQHQQGAFPVLSPSRERARVRGMNTRARVLASIEPTGDHQSEK
jgi:hypothetical protein